MPANDIEKLLEAEIEKHLDQLKRCRAALAGYRGETEDKAPQSKPLGWAAAIDEIFQPGETLGVEEVRERLAEKGLPAYEDQYLNTIRSTLARRAGEGGPLERVGVGQYRLLTGLTLFCNGRPSLATHKREKPNPRQVRLLSNMEAWANG